MFYSININIMKEKQCGMQFQYCFHLEFISQRLFVDNNILFFLPELVLISYIIYVEVKSMIFMKQLFFNYLGIGKRRNSNKL